MGVHKAEFDRIRVVSLITVKKEISHVNLKAYLVLAYYGEVWAGSKQLYIIIYRTAVVLFQN